MGMFGAYAHYSAASFLQALLSLSMSFKVFCIHYTYSYFADAISLSEFVLVLLFVTFLRFMVSWLLLFFSSTIPSNPVRCLLSILLFIAVIQCGRWEQETSSLVRFTWHISLSRVLQDSKCGDLFHIDVSKYFNTFNVGLPTIVDSFAINKVCVCVCLKRCLGNVSIFKCRCVV